MQTHRSSWKIWLIGVFFLLGLSACATIPPESADLSIELGKRISAIETSHMALVDKYFAEKRERVDEFLNQEWIPAFAAQFFANDQIAKLWDQAVRSKDPADRLQFIVTLGPKLQEKINQKRLQLIKPLDEAEALLKERLRNNYDQARAINNSLTSYLVSASKVAENRNRYLEMLGVKDEKVAAILDQVDTAVQSLTNETEKVTSKEKKDEEYFKQLMEIKNKLEEKGGR